MGANLATANGGSGDGLPGYATSRYGGDDPSFGAVVGSFFDHNQSPLQGVVVILKQGVLENYNPGTGDRR